MSDSKPPATENSAVQMKAAASPASRWNFQISQRLKESIQRRPMRSGIMAGFVATMLYSSYQNRAQQQKEETEDAKTKKVLVLPFYKMKIVEESRLNSLRALLSSSPDPGSQNVEMSVDECVRLIHQAAADPQIVALYGIMGHGHNFSTGGWAHVEEIRNALLVFSQAHRRHYEPGHPETAKDAPKKPMYLYTNTFAAPTPSGGADMKDYYLASVFSHIHLQPQGDLNLMGLHTTNTFYRDFLAKYGITVHVWKHGQFKNFANQFTHSQYNQPHAENVFNILRGIQQHVLGNLFESRYEKFKEYQPHNFWPMVLNAGSLPATVAQRIGFIDYLAPRNPLDDLVDYHTSKTTNTMKELLQEKWQNKTDGESDTELVPLTDLEGFVGTKPITIMEYARKFKQQEQRKEQMWQVYERMQKLSSGMQSILGLFGMSAPYFNFDKKDFNQAEAKGRSEQIAVLKISGPITDATARKLEQPLRRLKQSSTVRAVVIRVDSPGGAITACETIHQLLQDLPQKVVVSYGNVSASGGYYISAKSDRIFASPTTITGSIGVVMLRADLRGLADRWGIHFDSIPSSDFSGIFDPFFPMNSRMKENFANYCDRAYLHFKTLVSEGRGMTMDEVEKVAQGRVWTGTQALEMGLVDELGGLDRAIAYCQRTYTESGQAKVVPWPPKKTLFQAILDRKKKGDSDVDDFDNVEIPSMMESILEGLVLAGFGPWILGERSGGPVVAPQSTGVIASVEHLMQQGRLPMAMSGVLLTIDENAAIRCLLEQNNIPDVFGNLPAGFWDA